MDKDLAGWPHPMSCSQQLKVQMEISNEWCPSGVHTRINTINIFITDMDSEIMHLQHFMDDTKMMCS